ncbi:hypothetical protein V3C99_016320 [Haemonchus contortus]|uniref:Reverse transcriptase domain-containing protein n=1 Tax=Haemonchus contortus TaxID=6289 RepID=A0A7I4YXP3_HAECO
MSSRDVQRKRWGKLEVVSEGTMKHGSETMKLTSREAEGIGLQALAKDTSSEGPSSLQTSERLAKLLSRRRRTRNWTPCVRNSTVEKERRLSSDWRERVTAPLRKRCSEVRKEQRGRNPEESQREHLISLVKDVHDGSTITIRTPHIRTGAIDVTVRVHQRSALIIFLLTMDVIREELMGGPYKAILYADDIALIEMEYGRTPGQALEGAKGVGGEWTPAGRKKDQVPQLREGLSRRSHRKDPGFPFPGK